MKWKNKGHEFDELGALFQKNSEILVIGNKNDAQKICKKMEFLNTKVTCFTDIELFDLGHGLKKRIKQIKTKFIQNNFKNKTIVLANSFAINNTFAKILKKLKLNYLINYFFEDDFFAKYLSIYAVYVKNLVYSFNQSFIITTFCNLNCKSCLNFNPYIKHKEHRDLNELKENVDVYFKCIDKVGKFQLSGGEPQLYPHLGELLEYISCNYKNKIEILSFVTNGIITPSDEMCKLIKQLDVTVEIDNYTQFLPQLKEIYEKTVNKLKSFNIDTILYDAGNAWHWFEIFPPKNIIDANDTDKLVKKFEQCSNPHQELRHKKLYTCNYAEFAANADICPTHELDAYDLTIHTKDKNKELVEARLGYCERGYVEFCKICNGYSTINKEKVEPAKQVQGILEWNGRCKSNGAHEEVLNA